MSNKPKTAYSICGRPLVEPADKVKHRYQVTYYEPTDLDITQRCFRRFACESDALMCYAKLLQRCIHIVFTDWGLPYTN